MQDEELRGKKVINLVIRLVVILIGIFLVAALLFKYYVKNDAQTALKMNKIIVISTASGKQKAEGENIWHLDLNQDNDIFIYLEKNEKYTGKENIKKVSISDFSVTKTPNKGGVQLYKNLEDTETQSIDYEIVEIKPDLGINNICNEGGVIKFKINNIGIGEYSSNEDTAINHDGTILKKSEINIEDIQFSIKFSLIIEDTAGQRYKTNIAMDLPYGDVINTGVETKEFTNVSNAKFERIY